MLLYEISSYIGYFFVMIIFMVVAFVTAKRRSPWIWYAIGAVLQLIALLGNQKFPDANDNVEIDWIVYIGLLIISAVLIKRRYNKAQEDAYVYENSTDKSDI